MAERVVVIGAGPAGLLAARSHARRGAAVSVLEARAHLGGRVSPLELAGLTLDAGAESFATRGEVVADLAREVGLGDDVVEPTAAPAWVVSPGRAYPLPATGWLGIPTAPLDRAIRAVVGNAAALAAAAEPSRPLGDVPDDITVGALVRSRLGGEIAELLVAPVLQGVYSRSIDALPLAAIDPTLPRQLREAGSVIELARRRRALAPAGSAVQGIVGGVWRLTAALAADAAAHGASILTGTRVQRLTRADGAWHVQAGGGTIPADRVVVAAPAARSLVPGADATDSAVVALVTLVLRAPELDGAPRGTGVLAVGGVTRAKALTHATAKWEWLAHAAGERHVVRLSYALPDPAEDVAAHAVEDASRLLGVSLDPSQVLASAAVRWPDASPSTVDPEPADGVTLVGAAAGLSGLAAIVAAARDFAD